jgi:hypothetical protein
MPKPILTQHVLERLIERDITEEQVDTALAREQYRTPGQAGTIWIHGLVDGGRTLKICVSTDMSRVITAAWPGP